MKGYATVAWWVPEWGCFMTRRGLGQFAILAMVVFALDRGVIQIRR